MATFTTRMFGDVPLESDGAYVTRDVSRGARSYRQSLFVGDGLAQETLDRAATLLDDIETLDRRAREAIDAEDDDVPGYIAFHLEELEDDELRLIFGTDRMAIDRAAFQARLDLVGFGVHAHPTGAFSLVLDYSIGRETTDQLLAVTFDPSRRAVSVSHES